MNADGVLRGGGCSRLITGVRASGTVGLRVRFFAVTAAVTFFNFSADVPTSISRGGAKEVCLLAPPWLDLGGSAKGSVIT